MAYERMGAKCRPEDVRISRSSRHQKGPPRGNGKAGCRISYGLVHRPWGDGSVVGERSRAGLGPLRCGFPKAVNGTSGDGPKDAATGARRSQGPTGIAAVCIVVGLAGGTRRVAGALPPTCSRPADTEGFRSRHGKSTDAGWKPKVVPWENARHSGSADLTMPEHVRAGQGWPGRFKTEGEQALARRSHQPGFGPVGGLSQEAIGRGPIM